MADVGRGSAPDGSPLAVYRALPPGNAPDLIHAAIPGGAEILELGSGPGRLTTRLIELGHPVTAVDNDPEMVAAVALTGATPVLGDILDLDLGRWFPVVVLASHFIDTPPPDGDAFVAAAARHVAPDGIVLIEAYPPALDWTAAVGRRSQVGPVGVTVTRARISDERLEAAVAYELDGQVWEQPFAARRLDEPAIRSILDGAGLAFERWLDEREGWFSARPR